MYTVVTGAAGFIGSNIVRALNDRGETAILAVDDLAAAGKFVNLVDCEIAEYLDRDEFLARLVDGDFDDDIAAVLHQGACSDTMETDGAYMMRNNYRYSIALLEWCQDNDIPFLYASSASVYGGGRAFREDRACEAPLNVYGYSKFLFDQYVRGMLRQRTAQVAGFRYFNVYGPREQHKGRMASVAHHFFHQYRDAGRVKVFEGADGFAAGEQSRDFVAVEDVVNVNLDFLAHPDRSGIFNLGSGTAATFNEVACATINTLRKAAGMAEMSLAELVTAGAIEYVPFPPALVGHYQSYTQADLSRLRSAGYRTAMTPVSTGVPRYVERLISGAASAA